MYGKTFFRLVSFFLYYPNNKFFSIYNYLFRFFSSLFGFQWTFCRLCLLVGPSGLEPPTSCLSGTRSNLLSYDPSWLVFGVSLGLVEMMGFEPMTPCLQGRCSPSWATPPNLLGFFISTRGSFRFLGRVGIELFSRAASSQVFSPLQSLTSVFGMGTGGPSAFVTLTSFQ